MREGDVGRRGILRRPKTGKGGTQALLPFLQSLVMDGPLSKLVSEHSIASRGWLRPGEVRGYLARAKSPAVRWQSKAGGARNFIRPRRTRAVGAVCGSGKYRWIAERTVWTSPVT